MTCSRPRPGCSACCRCCSPAGTGPVPSWPADSESACGPCAATSTGCASGGMGGGPHRGVGGGYRLGVGAALPPLLLDDEEAVAVAISLHTAATGSVAGLEETALRALTKLQQMLPSRLPHRISAFHATTVALAGPGAGGGRAGAELV